MTGECEFFWSERLGWRRSVMVVLCILGCALSMPTSTTANGDEVEEGVPCAQLEFPELVVDEAMALVREGRGEEALHCLRETSVTFHDFAEIWEALGTVEESHGDAAAAGQAYAQAVELDPEYALAMLKLGNWQAARGQEGEAIALFQATIALRPDSAVPFNNLGLAYMRQRNPDAAIEAFTSGLLTPEDGPSRAMLLNNLGIVYKDMGDKEQAIKTFREAQVVPNIEASINLAGTLLDMGLYAEAEEEMYHGLQITFHVAGLKTLAAALAFQDKIVAAAQLILDAGLPRDDARRVVSEVAHQLAAADKGMHGVELMTAFGLPESEDYYHVAMMLSDIHQYILSMRAYMTAVRMYPEHERALQGMGVLLYKITRFRDAEKFFYRFLKVTKETEMIADAYNGLGAAVEMTHSRLDLATEYFENAVKLNRKNEPAFFSYVHILARICDWRQHDELFAETRELIDSGKTGGIGPIFALAYPLTDGQMCAVTKARAREAVNNIIKHRPEFVPWVPDYAAVPDRLGVAIISADFNSRPVGQLVQSVFGMMDKSRFEIFCYMFEHHDGSKVLVDIAHSVDEWFWVKGMSPLTVAQMVNNEQPHILLDLNGYTDGGRQEVAGLKPAPVAVNYLGFPYTLTIPEYNYILTDRIVTPPEQHASCFVEKVAFMPNTYMVNDHKQNQLAQIEGEFTPDDAKNRSLPHKDEELVLANFNHLQKLGPGTFSLWTQIMFKHPDAKLWLLRFPKEAEPHLRREMGAAGVEASRLLLTDKFASVEHLRVKRAASILLDTLEYNAHVSGLDALWAGLPLITMAGGNMARRCGASFLRTSQIAELLARTPSDYVDIASCLAASPAKLAGIRHRVEHQRMNGRLFDTQAWAGEFERMLRMMWEVAAASEGSKSSNLVMAGYNGW